MLGGRRSAGADRSEAQLPAMPTCLAFERESETVGIAVTDRKTADSEFARVDDLSFRQWHEF